MRTTKILLLLLLCTTFSCKLATADESITLEAATALALQANPNIAVVLRGREVESAQALQAASRPNPTLSGQVEDLRSQNRIATIAISQQLETAGKRDKRMAAADAALAMADADIVIAQAEISAKTYGAFYQVLAAQQAQTLAQELLQISTTSKQTTTKRVLAGKVSPVEETKAKVAEAGLKIELANANQQLAAAKQVEFEVSDHFPKQTYRSRFSILGPNGVQQLSIPLERPNTTIIPNRIDAYMTRDWPQVMPGRKPAYQAGLLIIRPDMDVFYTILNVIKTTKWVPGWAIDSGWNGKGKMVLFFLYIYFL